MISALEHRSGRGGGQRPQWRHSWTASFSGRSSGKKSLLFGAMTRAGLLIASSPDPKATRDAVGVTFRQMISGFLQTHPK